MITTETPRIYKVVAQTTHSLQPGDTDWRGEVLYCGTDLTDALIEYHRSIEDDYNRSYGDSCRRTVAVSIDPNDADDFGDYTMRVLLDD